MRHEVYIYIYVVMRQRVKENFEIFKYFIYNFSNILALN